MAKTVTIQPYEIAFRQRSSGWKTPERLYDGNLSTAPSNFDGYAGYKLDFSWLPSGAKITKMTARYYAKRSSSSMPSLILRTSNDWVYSYDTDDKIAEFDLPNGTYNVAEFHNATVTFSDPVSATASLLSKPCQYIFIVNSSTTGYELYLDVTYEENSTIYAGGGACIGGLRRRHTG